MREKIELMLKVYRERLERAQRPPIDHVLGLQTEAQIAVLENLYIYAVQEEPATPCPICGRVDDNHLFDVKHVSTKSLS